jgi:hypothetical protein
MLHFLLRSCNIIFSGVSGEVYIKRVRKIVPPVYEIIWKWSQEVLTKNVVAIASHQGIILEYCFILKLLEQSYNCLQPCSLLSQE